MEWLYDKPYERIGDQQWGNIHVIDAPASFVKDARKIFAGPTTSWFVETYNNWKPAHSFTGSSWRIIRIGYKDETIVILVMSNKWIRLNEARSLPLINKMMEASYKSVTSDKPKAVSVMQMSNEILEGFVDGVVQLYRNVPGGGGIMLVSQGFADSEDSFSSHDVIPSSTTTYTKQDSITLHSLSIPPVIVDENTGVEVSSNFINTNGGIEHWTLTLSPKDSLNIISISMRELYPSHSFPYPIIDD
jgi:hypothetical protein